MSDFKSTVLNLKTNVRKLSEGETANKKEIEREREKENRKDLKRSDAYTKLGDVVKGRREIARESSGGLRRPGASSYFK